MQPSDLSTYPDAAKLVWFDLVVKHGLTANRRDLRRGKDKDGNIHPLSPRTIKYRRSEVGPVTKTAPRGVPALDLSRVMSLLTGRAHTSSAEFWWKFDSHTGRSFAEILHYWADDQGHDVFGLSPQGRDWTLDKASRDWDRWLASPAAEKVLVHPGIPGAKLLRKAEVLRPIAKTEIGGTNLAEYDLFPGAELQIRRAIEAGTFSGFRRLNARGEQWRPGQGLGSGPIAPPPPPVKPKPSPVKPAAPKPAPTPKPAAVPVSHAMEIDAMFISPRIERAAKATFEIIDRIHSDGNIPRMPVRSMSHPDYEGYLIVGNDGRPRAMELNKAADTPRHTTAHETGHAIDYGGIPTTAPRIHENRDFRAEKRFKEFVAAVDQSESIKTLRSRQGQTTVHTEGAPWMNNYTIDQKHVAYLLQENEIWARAYCQWITEKSGDLDLLAELEHRMSQTRQTIYAPQWTREDFRPIAAAIETIFRDLGWLK
ncbi:MAG: hypothetical protein WBX00_26420 [Isosphaeraceae bacterium]